MLKIKTITYYGTGADLLFVSSCFKNTHNRAGRNKYKTDFVSEIIIFVFSYIEIKFLVPFQRGFSQIFFHL